MRSRRTSTCTTSARPASTWLANARSALKSALQYVEQHFADLEAKAKAEVSVVEANLEEPMTSTDAAAAGASAV
ncbi:hypothetical protein BSZ19_18525 [Bradyrhizobium japonicum]|uniref:Uncharacterized protein n=1 Tax=Bradyrhizobium japonicum TaxID=375 RepID=A0A1Y2JS03_BRAJP|nr:hypothetical protein [Bradyrhizobium japonicum]OSJ32547.1 hypothetical protein BSZ19_18525 [Bradyrhizobium japonicum]